MMKTRITILVALVALLLVGSSARAQPDAQPLPPWYVAGPGETAGGHYRLAGLSWRVNGAASGAGYHLLPALSGAEGGAASPASSENGCCCTYLPCVLRRFP